MPWMIYAAIALAVPGAALSVFAFRRAPHSEEFSGWDFMLMGGASCVALGVLAALMQVFTGAPA